MSTMETNGVDVVVKSQSDIRRLPSNVSTVRGHNLGDAEVVALSQRASIERLDLSGSDLVTDVSVVALEKLTRLRELDLSFCNLITDRSLEVLGKLPNIRWLSLNACYSVTDRGLSALANALSLETVSLWSCEKVSDVGVESLSSLPRLKHLELPEFANITDAGLKGLAGRASHLEVLRLDHLAEISDEGITVLRSLKRLAKLTVQGCQLVTGDAIAVLQSALPDCQIVFES